MSNDHAPDEKTAKGAWVNKDDRSLIQFQDVPAAVGLLTRLPVKVDMDKAQARSAAAAWAYPVAGLVVGIILAIVAYLSAWFGVMPSIAALLVLATSAIVTGAMHEDGLADSADGLWGGWDVARRLEIMKDSRIGVYGVLALIFVVLLRWVCLTALLQTDLWFGGLIATAMISRAAMVGVMAGLGPARSNGLSRTVGRPSPVTAAVAFATACVGSLICISGVGFLMILLGGLSAALCALIAHRKIGGQTGDILGATQQITEVVMLIALSALLV